jgi:hypothetical protein
MDSLTVTPRSSHHGAAATMTECIDVSSMLYLTAFSLFLLSRAGYLTTGSPQLVTSKLVSMRRFEPVTWRSHQKNASG